MKRLLAMTLAAIPLAASTAGAQRLDSLAALVQPMIAAAADSGVRVSVGLADISAPGGQALVLGSTEIYNPASTIKMALLATVMRQVDRGYVRLDAPISISPYVVVGGAGSLQKETMPYTTTIGDLVKRMVTLSDNTATNVLLYHVGLPTVQATLDDVGLKTMKFNRQMFPGDRITEPANVIDAADAVALLEAIYSGALLSEGSRRQVLDWMLAQEVDTKFGAVLEGKPVAHKTGETGNVTHDMGYFLVPGRETIVAVFTEVTASESFEETARVGNPIVQRIGAAIYAQLDP